MVGPKLRMLHTKIRKKAKIKYQYYQVQHQGLRPFVSVEDNI